MPNITYPFTNPFSTHFEIWNLIKYFKTKFVLNCFARLDFNYETALTSKTHIFKVKEVK